MVSREQEAAFRSQGVWGDAGPLKRVGGECLLVS